MSLPIPGLRAKEPKWRVPSAVAVEVRGNVGEFRTFENGDRLKNPNHCVQIRPAR